MTKALMPKSYLSKSPHLRDYSKSAHTNANENITIRAFYLIMKEHHIEDVPNIEIAVKIFPSIMVMLMQTKNL